MMKTVTRLMVEAIKWDFSVTTSHKNWPLVMIWLVKHMRINPGM